MIEQLDDLGDSAEARGRVLAAVDAHTAEALASRGGGQVEAVERVEAEVAAAPERAFRFAADGSAVLVAGRRRYQAGRFEVLALCELRARALAARARACLLYTSPSPRDGLLSRMPSSA